MVNNCDSGILPNLQANKLTCYSITDAGRIYKSLCQRQKREDFLLSKQHEPRGHVSYPCPSPTGQHEAAQADAVHTLGCITAEETQG